MEKGTTYFEKSAAAYIFFNWLKIKKNHQSTFLLGIIFNTFIESSKK